MPSSESTVKAIREGWDNAFYRATACYISVLVTVIFGMLVYRFVYDLPGYSFDRSCAEVSESKEHHIHLNDRGTNR